MNILIDTDLIHDRTNHNHNGQMDITSDFVQDFSKALKTGTGLVHYHIMDDTLFQSKNASEKLLILKLIKLGSTE